MRDLAGFLSMLLLCPACGDNGGPSNGPDTPPVIESITPVDEASNVAVSTNVWVVFSREMDPSSTEAAFALETGSVPVAGVFVWSGADMVFSPDSFLEQESTYTITVGTGASDTYGNELEDAFVSSFETGSFLGVLSVTPQDGATDVPIDTNAEVTFSTEMDTESVEGALTLESDAGGVSGSFSWDGNTVTFDPDADLLNARDYTLVVDRSAADTEGTHLTDPHSSGFTSGKTPPEVTGDIVAQSPTWTWTAPEDHTGYRYQLDGESGAWTEVEASVSAFTPEAQLPDGDHTLYVQARYNQDDWSESGSWTATVGPVLEGDLNIQTAADLEGFVWVEVTGDVTVADSALTDLAGMEPLRGIGGSLYISRNADLTSLNGLNNLASIGAGLTIGSNASLPDLTGLDSLASIGGNLSFFQSGSTGLNGLAVLTTVGGDLKFEQASPTNLSGPGSLVSIGGDLSLDRTSMTDLGGLDTLEVIGGGLRIVSDSSLTAIHGLDGVQTLGGGIHVSYSSVGSFDGLGSLTSIEGGIDLDAVPSLTAISGLGNLTTLGGNLRISQSHSLVSLAGLGNLESVGGSLTIHRTGLADLTDVGKLASVGEDLTFNLNDDLVTLDGLAALASIGGDLDVNANLALTRLSDLLNLQSLGGDMSIQYNSVLPTCEATRLENHLRALGWTGTASIADNDDAGTCD